MPKPRDLTVCQRCAIALVFDSGLRLRPLVPADLVGISRDEMQALTALRRSVVEEIERRGMGGYN